MIDFDLSWGEFDAAIPTPKQIKKHRPENQETRICCVCVIEKAVVDFPLDKRKRLGFGYCCNQCIREKQRNKTKQDRLMIAYSVAAQARAAGVHDIESPIFIKPVPPPQQYDGEVFRCRKCQQNKPLTEFAKAPRKEGHDLWCRECSKERKKKSHLKIKAAKITKEIPWEEKAATRCNERAREKRLPYGMKPADLHDQNTGALPIFCPIFPNIRLDYNRGSDRRRHASVDKIVPALGYVSGNVWVVSMAANTWKSNGSNPDERKRIVEIMEGKKSTRKSKNVNSPTLF